MHVSAPLLGRILRAASLTQPFSASFRYSSLQLPRTQLHLQLQSRPFSASSQTMAAQEYKLKGLTSLSISPGAKQEIEVEGIEDGKVLLVNAGGRIQALGAKCTHYGAPLSKGVLTSNGRLTCPWHGGI